MNVICHLDFARQITYPALSMVSLSWFSDHFAGYFKNENNEKNEKERKRERITGSQQLTSSSYINSVQVIKCAENLSF